MSGDPNIPIALGMYKELKPYDKKPPTYEERMGLPPTAKQIKEAALEPKGRKKKLTPDEKLAKKKDAKLRKGRRKELNKVETKIRKREKKGMGMEDRRAPVGKNIKNIRTGYSVIQRGQDIDFVEKFIKLAVEKYPTDKESAIRMLMNTSKGRDLTIPLLKDILAEMGGISYPAYEKIWKQSKIPALELNKRTKFIGETAPHRSDTAYGSNRGWSGAYVRTDRYDPSTAFGDSTSQDHWWHRKYGGRGSGKEEVYDYEGGRYFTTNAGEIIYPETNPTFDWGVDKSLSPFNMRREIWTGGVPVYQEGNYSVEPDEDTAMLPEIKPDTILKSFPTPKKILLEMFIDIYVFYAQLPYYDSTPFAPLDTIQPKLQSSKSLRQGISLSPVVVPIGEELTNIKYSRDKLTAYNAMKKYFRIGATGSQEGKSAYQTDKDWEAIRGKGKEARTGFVRPKPPNDMSNSYSFTHNQLVAAARSSWGEPVPEVREQLSYYYNAGNRVWLVKNNTGNIFAAFTRNKSYIQQRDREQIYDAGGYRTADIKYTFGKSIEDQLKEDLSPLNANLQKYLNTNIQNTTNRNVRHF
tara:strand:+ start:607 stop:2343 length:1737 start_codon:yes stop_codon:yes gene_type:complete